MKRTTLFCFSLLFFSLQISYGQVTQLKIGILTDQMINNPVYVDMLTNEIDAIVGSQYQITYQEPLENNYSVSKAKSNYTTVAQDADIVLAFGTVNSLAIADYDNYPVPTIILGAINRDFIDTPEDKAKTGVNNLSYIINSFSYTEDLDAFYDLHAFEKVAILCPDHLIEQLPMSTLFDDYFKAKEATYKLLTYEQQSTFDQALADVDAVYFTDTYNIDTTELISIAQLVNKKKIPSFSASSIQDVERGVLATNRAEEQLNQLFRRIGLNIEDIIGGKNAAELPLYVDAEPQLTINVNTVSKINFPVRVRLLAEADFTGDFSTFTSDDALSLNEVLDRVLNDNYSLQANLQDVYLQGQEVQLAKSNFFPDLTLGATSSYLDPNIARISNGNNPELSGSANLTLQQLLYSREAHANIGIQQQQLAAQEKNYEADQLDAILNTAGAYLNVLIRKTNVAIQNQNFQITKKNLRLARQNFEGGVSSKADILRFRTEMTQNAQQLINAGNALQQAFNDLNQLMSFPIDSFIDVQDIALDQDFLDNYNYEHWTRILDNPELFHIITEFLVQEALQNAPELASLESNLMAINKLYELNDKGRYYPTLALQAQYNLNLFRAGEGTDPPQGFPTVPDNNYSVGVNLSFPIFQQNQRNIKRQSNRIQMDQLHTQQNNLELNIEKNINNALIDLTNEVVNIEISKIAELTARENLELTQNAYANGVIPVIQLIDAQNNYFATQQAKVTAFYQYLLASFKLERGMSYFFMMHTDESNEAFIQRVEQYLRERQ